MSKKPPTPAVFQILLALADGELHGYAIMQAVSDDTKNMLSMGPGTLYGALKRMVDAGLVEECREHTDPGMNDERRIYYRITGHGRRVAATEAERMAVLVRSAREKALIGPAAPKATPT